MLHEGVCHCTSAPHKSGNKMKREKRKSRTEAVMENKSGVTERDT